MGKLPFSYYLKEDPVALSRDLLGKVLCTCINEELTTGIITETEAYKGPEDRASHAYDNRRTRRNEVMYHEGGVCYVYKCYGIHDLFNVVTNEAEIPHAILIRAIEPLEGVEVMLQRRKRENVDNRLVAGPGTLSQALGIGMQHNGLSLSDGTIWIEDRGITPQSEQIIAEPRIGIGYAGKDALLPWRFIYARSLGLHKQAQDLGFRLV